MAIIYGTSGDDHLDADVDGRREDDVVFGGAGDDFIDNIRHGNDYVLAGAGDDIIQVIDHWTAITGHATISGGSGTDRLAYVSGANEYAYVDLEAGSFGVKFFGNNIERGTLIDIEDVSIHGGSAEVLGNAGNNRITTREGNDYLDGRGGNDALEAGSGDDHLIGGAGNDSLDGGTGNDILEGGTGNDVIRGGGGEDTFVFAGDTGSDTVYNFGVDDVMDFSGVAEITSFSDLMNNHITDLGWIGIRINFGDSQIVSFYTTFEWLTEDNFIF
ncbi:MAG: calcium-binding protein [Pseudomonadota bacterium]